MVVVLASVRGPTIARARLLGAVVAGIRLALRIVVFVVVGVLFVVVREMLGMETLSIFRIVIGTARIQLTIGPFMLGIGMLRAMIDKALAVVRLIGPAVSVSDADVRIGITGVIVTVVRALTFVVSSAAVRVTVAIGIMGGMVRASALLRTFAAALELVEFVILRDLV